MFESSRRLSAGNNMTRRLLGLLGFGAVLALVSTAFADDAGWIVLMGEKEMSGWQKPTGAWQPAASVALDAANPRQFKIESGAGVFVNGPKGRTTNLITRERFGDLEAHVEFCVPKGSNSGIKFQAVYEIQIFDSFGAKSLDGADCGGIYPRSLSFPKYHHIDDGIAPSLNACRKPGEWQTLDMIFLAPRFDAAGKKTANARMLKVVLNEKLIHDNVEMITPTGNNWDKPEHPTGPFFLQADHGPVAFRNVKVRPYRATQSP
jgi:3-keto-disaccharide hydrolase